LAGWRGQQLPLSAIRVDGFLVFRFFFGALFAIKRIEFAAF
jgi:hypothetical protein